MTFVQNAELGTVELLWGCTNTFIYRSRFVRAVERERKRKIVIERRHNIEK